MADPSPMHQRPLRDASDPLGELIAEFKEETAGVPLTIGHMLATVGALLLGAQLLIDLHEFLIALGVLWIVMGLVLVAVGRSLKKNCLLVHAEGLVQFKGGEPRPSRWKDVQEILVEERRRYASGVCYSVDYLCNLRQHDGTVTKVDAVTITPRILKIIQERWEMSTTD
jgi:hypothetical protein